jgi:hypothetical protein
MQIIENTMPKKKTHKHDEKPKVTFFSVLVKILIFIVKIPYFIVSGIYSLFVKAKEVSEKTTIKKKKEKMLANYEQFKLIETIAGDFFKWESKIISNESKIGIILGARGSWKTAFGVKFLENLYAKTKKKCYAMGFKEEDMPSWIECVEDVSQVKNDAFVLIDEGGVLFSARDAMSKANKILSDLILVARHKNLSIIFISQNSSNLDIDILRQADYLILKQNSLLQLDFERKKIKEIYTEIKNEFERHKETPGITYIYSDLFRGFVSNTLPSFWSTNISKSFK